MSTSRPERLEGAAIRLLWEAVAEAKRPVMVRSDDDESAALVHLARRAFHPVEPPFPIVAREALAAAAAKRGFDLVIDAARGAGAANQPAPIWRLGHATKRRGETVRLFPLAGWTEADVRDYVAVRSARATQPGRRAQAARAPRDLPCAFSSAAASAAARAPSPLFFRGRRARRARTSATSSSTTSPVRIAIRAAC